ncbi:MAG: OmpA family protein [Elusimicrobia bacterium]|nr:OmpA family protein [Elusimicrobiota bacterium]
MKKHIVAFSGLILLSGCVSANKYKVKESELSSAHKEIAGLKDDYNAFKDTSQKTDQDLRAQIDALHKSNKDFQDSLDAKKGELSKKVSELIQERDDLSQKLSAKEQEALALTQARDKALEERKTVELAKEAELARVTQTKDQEALALAQARDKALEEKKAAEAAKETELAQVKKNYEDLAANLKSEIANGEITITQLKGKLTVNMVDRILFASGLAVVKADGKKVLERIGSVLNSVKDKYIRIEGHTDNVPISSDLKNKYPTNWELSTARATAVARYLQDVAKVDPQRLVAAGYGEYKPIAPNDTPEHKALNRRIEIVLVPRE